MANTLTNLTNTLLAEQVLQAFMANIAPLRAFALNVSADPAARGDKVKVMSVPAASAAADFAGTYTAQDSTADGLDVTLNKHKFVSWYLTDTQVKNMPQLEMERFASQKGFQLAKAVLQDIWSVITNANYGAAAFTGAASTFDVDDVVDISDVCDSADWRESGRSLILKSSYHAALRKDNAIQQALNYGTDATVRRGIVPSLDTFEAIYKSTLIPANGENLVGFAVLPDAILCAMRYLNPQEGNDYAEAQPITDPESGFTLGWRKWYDKDTGTLKTVMECNYGYLKGTAAGLKRLVSA